jgi:hypothetical protein
MTYKLEGHQTYFETAIYSNDVKFLASMKVMLVEYKLPDSPSRRGGVLARKAKVAPPSCSIHNIASFFRQMT